MIEILGYCVEVVFLFATLMVCLFSVGQLNLSFFYIKSLRSKPKLNQNILITNLPYVTVQLPVYNERYVVERLIDAVSEFDYPKDKLEIQVLDDSDDDSVDLISAKVKYWQQRGLNIAHITRADRNGFKAGALRDGMRQAKGEFFAIFDADFLPKPDFLMKIIPYFENEKVGMVQSRWGHLNENFSLLTRMQAYALDAHFTVEQKGRNASGMFMNFNGTCGVWRKHAIVEAGGWQPDTLTEDLDLSYRSQLKGWEFIYLENIFTPGELPVTMSAVKSQQFRWMKGPAEVARKNFSAIYHAKIGVLRKFHAAIHLLNSSVFIWVLLSGLSSLAYTFFISLGWKSMLPMSLSQVSLLSLCSLVLFFVLSRIKSSTQKGVKGILGSIFRFPLFLCFVMGISLHNAIAALEGWFGKKSSFIRTPKFGIVGTKGNWKYNVYNLKKIHWLTWAEGFLSVLFGLILVIDFKLPYYPNLIYHFILALGFGVVFFLSIKHSIVSR